ncbi:MAG: hypothetical protein M3R11_08165 [Acidobacteriota bacterium]|nr:hypothetical protein [Acidobacteriota bacterium]
MFSEQGNKTSLIGKEIRHYKIEQLLGKGRMGEVYRRATVLCATMHAFRSC